MSALSSSSLGSSLSATTLPPIDPALEPASVRNGNQAAKNAYQEGLAFEDILVNQLVTQMTATVPGLDGSSDGSDGSDASGSSGGLSGSGSGLGAYASLLPQALTSSVMSTGGTGIAMEIARSIDPALGAPTGK
ncbi:MAG TPA: hypothetical protein VG371_17220 [Solirubrobacteraceae bacterium]|nr:hypothetical protein [Solirubrobacteraceae bacterium]